MSPSFAVGVWVGFDENLRVGRGATGGRTALPVFIDIMDELGDRERQRSFERPGGIVEARVDEATGLLAHAEATSETTYLEVFLEGTEPNDTAPAPGEVDEASFVLDQYDDFGGWGLEEGDDEEDDAGGVFGGGSEGDEDGAGTGGIFGGDEPSEDDGSGGGIFGGEDEAEVNDGDGDEAGGDDGIFGGSSSGR